MLKINIRFFFFILHALLQVVQAQSTFDSIVKPKKFMGFVPLSDTISEDKNGLFALPLLYFTPDTRWAAGAAGVYYFKVKPSEANVTQPRVSYIQFLADYTQNKQLDTWASWHVFTQDENYLLKGDLRYRDFPDRFYGIGNNSREDDMERYYYDLLSFRPLDEVAALKQQVAEGANPRDIKILLAKEIIARFHDDAAAEAAHQDFTQRFSKNALPDDIPELTVNAEGAAMPIANLLKEAGLVESTSEAMRMIKQGAVKLNGDTKVEDAKLEFAKGSSTIFQVGKRKFAKVTLV